MNAFVDFRIVIFKVSFKRMIRMINIMAQMLQFIPMYVYYCVCI